MEEEKSTEPFKVVVQYESSPPTSYKPVIEHVRFVCYYYGNKLTEFHSYSTTEEVKTALEKIFSSGTLEGKVQSISLSPTKKEGE